MIRSASAVNAIIYINRTGGQWRHLPRECPPWQTAYGYFRARRIACAFGKATSRNLTMKRQSASIPAGFGYYCG
jgi:transposase